MTEPWTIGRVLEWARKDFADRGADSPRLEAELLLAHALGLARIDLYTRHDQPLGGQELAAFRVLVARRRQHEPVAYIRGVREFHGHAFRVDRHVLVPRPETEGVVDAVLELLGPPSEPATVSVLDIGTGSGCIAASVALARSDVRVDAVDLSPDAAAIARSNLEQLGVAGRVRVHVGDLYAPVTPRRFAIIVSNPPYIPTGEIATLSADVREHEPALALDGGAVGDRVLAPLLHGARAHLEPHGAIVVELGHGQAVHARALAEAAGLTQIEVRRDLAGIERVLIARIA